MIEPARLNYASRPTVTIELPLAQNNRIPHPEKVILKIANKYFDVGAFCYAKRSAAPRKRYQPREVVLDSLLNERPRQIRLIIKGLSRLMINGGKRENTVQSYLSYFRNFLDLADANELYDCLSGGAVTHQAFVLWEEDTNERYRRQQLGEDNYNARLYSIRELLTAITLEELPHYPYKYSSSINSGTEPLAPHDFAHGVALNQALFDGLCELVLEQRPFPYKLTLPNSLGWTENHLWIFPTHRWCLPPYLWGTEREKRGIASWAYNYAGGCLNTPEDIAHRYSGRLTQRLRVSRRIIDETQARIDAANADPSHRMRLVLGMLAHHTFEFLFFCNTGCNESVAKGIETEGEISSTTLNQHYRSVKFRANAKSISLRVPATFMPSLRRFMELRRYLLRNKSFPYLFFTLGVGNAKPPTKLINPMLAATYKNVLRLIDPQLPRMGPGKLRASVSDWYQRHHDVSITAKILQNSEKTTQKHYDAGSATDHHQEMSLFLNAVSKSARRQQVIASPPVETDSALEEGGHCADFGNPEAAADYVPVKPDCKNSQGCLFCIHRVLVACEQDARKVASAAFLMEQVIVGPMHEAALRPLIIKCDRDLEMIAAFNNCHTMVEQVRQDVFVNGNLTPFFADKYQLFIELGVIV